MNLNSVNLPRCSLSLLVFSCIFGNLFPFLNINLGFVILTPFRSMLILAGVYCLFIWWKRLKNKEALAILKKDRTEWLVFLFFVAWFALGAGWIVFGAVGGNAITDVVGILTVCVFSFCCFTLVRDIHDVRFLLRLLVICGVILALLAYVEIVIGSFVPETRYYLTLAQKIERKQTLFSPTAVFYNPNDFAAFMLLCLTIVCYRGLRAKALREFLCWLAVALVMFIPTVLTNSSFFNIFSIILIGLTVLALLLFRGRPWKIRLAQACIILVVSLLFVLFGTAEIRSAAVQANQSYFTVQMQKYYAQNQEPNTGTVPGQDQPDPEATPLPLPEIDYSDMEDPETLSKQLNSYQNNYGTIHIRKWLIIAGLDFLSDNPLLGNGPDSFHGMISKDADYLQQTRGITNPHCFYIELLSQYGILLFAAYMGIVLFLAFLSGRQTLWELRSGRLGWGTLCFLLTGFFSAVVLMPSSIVRLTPIWIFLILIICIFCKGAQAESVPTAKE